MKYFDAFAGYGGFSLGIKQAYESISNKQSTSVKQDGERRDGVTNEMGDDVLSSSRTAPLCVGFSEVDKYAIQVYKKHFNHKNYGDITTIDPTELEDFDLFCGGFPCQAFSIAGKRAGFEDTRGTLIYDVFRIIKEKQPKFVLLENVKGLLSHDSGNTFKTILTSLAELGYAVEWQVLNAKNFGVPQNRERVFVVGCFRGFGGRKVFPITGENSIACIEAGTVTAINGHDILKRAYSTKGISPVLNTCGGGNTEGKFIIASRGRNPENPSDRRTGSPTEQRLEPNKQGITNTLTNVQKDNWLKDENRIRRLTPKECERLMGLPDGWTEEGVDHFQEEAKMVKISDTQRYKLCGNGVVVNVVEEIIKRLI